MQQLQIIFSVLLAGLVFTARSYADQSGATVPLCFVHPNKDAVVSNRMEAFGPIMKRATIPGASRAIGLSHSGPNNLSMMRLAACAGVITDVLTWISGDRGGS